MTWDLEFEARLIREMARVMNRHLVGAAETTACSEDDGPETLREPGVCTGCQEPNEYQVGAFLCGKCRAWGRS